MSIVDSSDSSLSAQNAFLIAPPGEYDEFLIGMAARGVSCDVGTVPLEEDKIQSVDQVFVWLSSQGKQIYEQVCDDIRKLDKKVITVTHDTWKKVLVECYGEVAEASYSDEDESLLISQSADVAEKNSHKKEDPSNHKKQIKKAVQEYLTQLKYFASYSMQRLFCEHRIEPGTPLDDLFGRINRWISMSLSYRKTAKQIKPWKISPCPEGVNKTTWEILQSSIFEQSHMAPRLLKKREEVLNSIANNPIVQDQVVTWERVTSVAQEYLIRRQFHETFQAIIDKEGLQKEVDGEQDNLSKSLFKSRELKALEEAQKALKSFREKEKKTWHVILAMEFDSLKKDLTDRFWNFYEEIAVDWVKHSKPSFAHDHKRRFLRTGFLGRSAAHLDTQALKKLTTIILDSDFVRVYNEKSIHTVYFDELLELIARQEVAPSYDEELELNNKGSPEWKASRILRKIATHKRDRLVFLFQKKKNEEKLADLSRQEKEIIQKIGVTHPRNRDLLKNLKEQNHEIKVNQRRVQSFVEKIHKGLRALKKPPARPWPILSLKFDLEFWIRKEVKHLRSKVRLMNKIKDQNLPQSLMEDLTTPSTKPISRDEINKNVSDILKNDVAVFDRILVPNKKRPRALIAHVPPLIVIAPCGALDGLCLEPTSHHCEGRLMMPMFNRSSNSLRRLLVDVLSAYRWDTSMLKAGMEWNTSDTLVGAYSRCRWDYRHKDKEVREKALFYKEETDKKNFRRHYRLFEKSAQEGGKLLFYKSRLAYEYLIPYLVLPEGAKRLDR